MFRVLAVRRLAPAAAFALAFAPLLVRAQAPAPPAGRTGNAAVPNPTLKPITLEDYARFKRIAGAAISSDGKWMLYTVTPNEGDGTLFVKSLDTSTRSEERRVGKECRS